MNESRNPRTRTDREARMYRAASARRGGWAARDRRVGRRPTVWFDSINDNPLRKGVK